MKWEDFAFLGEARNQLERLMSAACAKRVSGLNILIYGPKATGKTEFVKALAERLGLTLYTVADVEHYQGRSQNHLPLTLLPVYGALARRRTGSALLLDDMDDVLMEAHNTLDGPARAWERSPVPTIWVVTNPLALDPAFIRRVGFALAFTPPPLAAREKAWSRTLRAQGVQLPDNDIREWARHDQLPPAIVEGAVRVSLLTGAPPADLRQAAQTVVRAMTGVPGSGHTGPSHAFHPGLVNPDSNISLLPGQVAAAMSRTPANQAFSLCLYGPPGTGKSAFVRYLASCLGMSVLMKRASDLLGPYVGQTEQKIARAFEQAREERMFLVFDEADSFLGDRSRALRSWEVSLVNEMLTWMESHPLPFACTTNLMDILDEASLRRFTFKVRFDYLEATQIAEAFRFFFGIEPPAGALALGNLTAGDFSVARRKAEVLGVLGDPTQLEHLLAGEAELKRSAGKPIGFGAPPAWLNRTTARSA